MFSSPEEARRTQALMEGTASTAIVVHDDAAQEHMPMAARALDLQGGSMHAPVRHGWDDGEEFFGGMGPVQLNLPDYWTLRARNAFVFETNQYARGIVRRLVTNVVATGLHLESIPNESLLGFADDDLAPWAEETETRFTLWGNDPYLCDTSELQTFGAIQAQAWLEALVGGDVLVTLQQGPSKTPRIRLIPGEAVQTPWDAKPHKGNRIEHGVELDSSGRHVAFWVRQRDLSFKRLPAWGEKSGRRLAWLVYGSDKRANDVRGRPLLSLILQSLTELTKYRSATQRKALIASILAVWIERTQDKLPGPGLGNMATGAQRMGATAEAAPTTEPRTFSIEEYLPGAIVEDLQAGEKVHPFSSNGVTESFGNFETAIVQGMAWALEVPPEILTLSFSSNYSASRAAMGEFDVYLYKHREWIGQQLCAPVYQEWLISECLAGTIKAPKLLEAWRSTSDTVTYNAWIQSDWAGHLRGHLDPVKQMAGFEKMLEAGVVTRDRVARWTSGQKFSRVTKQLKRENEALAAALAPLQAMGIKAPIDPALYVIPDDDEDQVDPKKGTKK